MLELDAFIIYASSSFKVLEAEAGPLDASAYNTLLSRCIKYEDRKNATKLLAHIEKLGLPLDVFRATLVLRFNKKCKGIDWFSFIITFPDCLTKVTSTAPK